MYLLQSYCTCIAVADLSYVSSHSKGLSDESSHVDDQGFGLDWGAFFPREYLAYLMTWPKVIVQDPKVFAKRCQVLEKRQKIFGGACSVFGSCIIGFVQYFGYFCSGLTSGEACSVEIVDYLTVSGECTEQGHCLTGQGNVRYNHDNCGEEGWRIDKTKNNDKDMVIDRVDIDSERNMDKETGRNVDLVRDVHRTSRNMHIEKDGQVENKKDIDYRQIMETEEDDIIKDMNETTKESSNLNGQLKYETPPLICKGLYNPSAYTKLINICRDCFNLYRVPEVYFMCLRRCFHNKHLIDCAKILLLNTEKVETLVNLVGK